MNHESTKDIRTHYRGSIASAYDQVRDTSPKWRREQAIVEEFISTMRPGSKVLDIPVGTGRFLEAYLHANVNVLGVDISPDMLAIAQDKLSSGDFSGRVDLRIADATATGLEESSFDYVICSRLMNLVSFQTVALVLGELTRVTRGQVLVGIRLRESYFIPRALGLLLRRPARTFKLILGALGRRARGTTPPHHRQDGVATRIHAVAQFHDAISRCGLRVRRRMTVDESDYSLGSLRAPLYFYVLSRDDSQPR